VKKIVVRAPRPRDVDDLFELIREFARHENMLSKFALTPENLKGVLFCKPKQFFCIVAEADERIVGYAIWSRSFAFFRGGWVLFLEGLYVRSRYRGRGIGKQLLAHVAKRAIRERCLGVRWEARTSNKKAIGFYKSLAAKQLPGNCQFVLSGGALRDLAEKHA
jgi:ribosomal protein S18 acetylase RimI-like enzyme